MAADSRPTRSKSVTGVELHVRLLLFHFFSPLKKKLNDDHFSWVTFTDPVAARINQKLVVAHQDVSPLLQTALDGAYRLQEKGS